jgi:hypothetical protein
MSIGYPRLRGSAAGAYARLLVAVSSLYDQAVDRVLATPQRVTSAAEAKALLASREREEGLADQVQRVVLAALPVIRLTARGARFTGVPMAFAASTALSVGTTVRTGVRETQLLASLLAHRIEEATGAPADPALVKKLAVELYVAPKRRPELSSRRLHLGRLLRRWVFRGAFGRDTGRAAKKALDAAERLDLGPHLAAWEIPPRPKRRA